MATERVVYSSELVVGHSERNEGTAGKYFRRNR